MELVQRDRNGRLEGDNQTKYRNGSTQSKMDSSNLEAEQDLPFELQGGIVVDHNGNQFWESLDGTLWDLSPLVPNVPSTQQDLFIPQGAMSRPSGSVNAAYITSQRASDVHGEQLPKSASGNLELHGETMSRTTNFRAMHLNDPYVGLDGPNPTIPASYDTMNNIAPHYSNVKSAFGYEDWNVPSTYQNIGGLAAHHHTYNNRSIDFPYNGLITLTTYLMPVNAASGHYEPNTPTITATRGYAQQTHYANGRSVSHKQGQFLAQRATVHGNISHPKSGPHYFIQPGSGPPNGQQQPEYRPQLETFASAASRLPKPCKLNGRKANRMEGGASDQIVHPSDSISVRAKLIHGPSTKPNVRKTRVRKANRIDGMNSHQIIHPDGSIPLRGATDHTKLLEVANTDPDEFIRLYPNDLYDEYGWIVATEFDKRGDFIQRIRDYHGQYDSHILTPRWENALGKKIARLAKFYFGSLGGSWHIQVASEAGWRWMDPQTWREQGFPKADLPPPEEDEEFEASVETVQTPLYSGGGLRQWLKDVSGDE